MATAVAPNVLVAGERTSVVAKAFPATYPLLVFVAGEEIHAQGKRADRLYRVEFGMVRAYLLMADGRRLISSFHLPGEVFGLEVDGVHHFFADAIGVTGLRAIPYSTAGDVLQEIMEDALRAHMHAQEHLLLLGRQNAVERIAAFLLDMAERKGGLEQFELPMSRGDIGDYLGLSIETVSRVISKLRADGVIGLVSLRTLRILKPAILKALSASPPLDSRI